MNFNTANARAPYACADPITASLRVVPPGETRCQLYCLDCPFTFKEAGCLFTPSYAAKPEPYQLMDKRHQKKRRERKERFRARGLTETGGPLTITCWNCDAIRKNGDGYVCHHSPQDPPGTMASMLQRHASKLGCAHFKMRRVMNIRAL